MSGPLSARDRLQRASRLWAEGAEAEARKICRQVARLSDLTMPDGAALLRLLREMGDDADPVEARLRAQLDTPATGASDLFDRAQALVLLDQREAALAGLDLAITADPAPIPPALLYLRVALHSGRAADALPLILRVAGAQTHPGRLLLAAAKIMGLHGQTAAAETLLTQAEPHYRDACAEFDFVAAGLRGQAIPAGKQRDMAVAIFDKFAADYDDTLTSIRNNGPQMIGRVLGQLDLPRKRGLQVLDAGCGTGLCAAHLRPYANRLHGVDVSVGMLEQARAKRTYDTLTRSDLTVAGTLPAGPFDLIVAADVLTYFGDLTGVLRSLAGVLRPGGWLVMTVEDGGDMAAPGYGLGPSGRFRHSVGHIGSALSTAGVNRPKHQISDTLRLEFGMPVGGLALAAQKLALAF